MRGQPPRDRRASRDNTKKKLRILLIDDDDLDREAVRFALDRTDLAVEVVEALDGASGLEQLNSAPFDCILLDHHLPDTNGHEVLQRLTSGAGAVPPILMLTGLGNETLALETMEAGAMDYLDKEEVTPTALKRAIRYAMARHAYFKAEVQARNLLERKNRELAELYRTAHKFVDNVSHEFRTPLTVIREYAAVVREGLMGPLNDEQAELLDVVLQRTEDLSIMVADMLDISKLETGLLTAWRRSCPLSEVLHRARGMLECRAQAAKGMLKIEIAPQLPNVFCDPEKVSRVILNLVTNAFKFSEEGGCVRVWARRDRESGFIRIGVTDDGPGIASESLHEIFERFKQVGGSVAASTKGFGLGLSIAKEMVQMNLGRIEVESSPGRGSTFSFTLPEADLRTVVGAHLRLLEQRKDSPACRSLLRLSVSDSAPIGLLEEVDQFLPRQLRHTDLICRNTLHTWLVVLAADDPDPNPILARLDSARTNANRNRIGAPIPSIRSELLDTTARDDADACADRFLQILRRAPGPSSPLELVA